MRSLAEIDAEIAEWETALRDWAPRSFHFNQMCVETLSELGDERAAVLRAQRRTPGGDAG